MVTYVLSQHITFRKWANVDPYPDHHPVSAGLPDFFHTSAMVPHTWALVRPVFVDPLLV